MKNIISVLVVLLILTNNCGSESPDDVAAAYDQLEELSLELELEIGESEHFIPGRLSNLAVFPVGTLLVRDQSRVVVEQFTPDGEYAGIIAIEGGGPGEISGNISLIPLGVDELLIVHAGGRKDYYTRGADRIFSCNRSVIVASGSPEITVLGRRSESEYYARVTDPGFVPSLDGNYVEYRQDILAVTDPANIILADSLKLLKMANPNIAVRSSFDGTIESITVHTIPPFPYRSQDRFFPMDHGRYMIARVDSSDFIIRSLLYEPEQKIHLNVKPRPVERGDLEGISSTYQRFVPAEKPPFLNVWITYGLGSENDNFPGFMVLLSGGQMPDAGKSVWSSGFIPSIYQGVQCRTDGGEPVLYASNPDGIDRKLRRQTIDAINEINRKEIEDAGDPEILTRFSQYEMAYRMQASVPEVMDFSQEPDYIHEMYGTEPGRTCFANNCLLARRLVEQDVRFIQLFDWGWDSHRTDEATAIDYGFREKCRQIDRPMTALVKDLKQRGMLEETLLVWGGEFGRTPMQENREGLEMPYLGRDHHTEAYTIWMVGGGIKGGFTYGETDEIGFAGIKDRVHVHDLQATILYQMGLDHKRLTRFHQGRDFRLTDVHGEVVKGILI